MSAMAETPKPWYREPWPWLLMLAPFAAVVMGVVMAVLAGRSNDGLVADDYYKQGLAINQTLGREQRAAALRVAGRLEFDPDRTRVRLMLAQDGEAPPALLLTLAHPTRAGLDQQVTLIRRSPGEFEGRLGAPVAGRWLLILEDDDRKWRVNGTWHTSEDRVSMRAGNGEAGR